jgi:alkylation response protein AidB-like acyl-CoA dehydrogenase
MCLTEPHCGTDLGLLRTKAEPQADGSYKITGNKIFISAGEHDMRPTSCTWCWRACRTRPRAARASACSSCPSSSQGRRQLGERNPVVCTGLEHKMGIHGNATCQISLDGAVGTWWASPTRAWPPCS